MTNPPTGAAVPQDGGPAFPHSKSRGHLQDCLPGMSLRDWFAGQALPQAIMDYDRMTRSGSGKDDFEWVTPHKFNGRTREQIIAAQAYQYADALLSARGETK